MNNYRLGKGEIMIGYHNKFILRIAFISSEDYGSVRIRGELIADRGYEHLRIEIPIYDSLGNRCGTATDSISHLRQGEKWIFEATSIVPRNTYKKFTYNQNFIKINGTEIPGTYKSLTTTPLKNKPKNKIDFASAFLKFIFVVFIFDIIIYSLLFVTGVI